MPIQSLYHLIPTILADTVETGKQVATEVATQAAQAPTHFAGGDERNFLYLGGGIAICGALIAAGYAISRISCTCLECTARQPEMAGKMQTMMILGIAFLEALVLLAVLMTGLPILIR